MKDLHFGLPLTAVEKIRDVFALHPEVQKVVLYGSRAKGNYKTGSDIDLTMYGDDLNHGILLKILDELDDLLLPWMIDLSIFGQIDNVSLREHIERVGVVFYQREGAGAKSGWQTTTLGDACRFIDYRGRTPETTDSGLRLITAKNVKMGFLQQEPLEKVAPESYDNWMTRGIPQKGDVLFTTEPPLANVAQLDTDEKVVFAQRIIILQPKEQDLNSTFLKYLLLSDNMQKQILEKGTGATVQGIKAKLLKGIEVSFPSLTEQLRIVSILDEAFDAIATAKKCAEKNLQNSRALHNETKRLETIYHQKLAALDELKKSLLDQAFTGEL